MKKCLGERLAEGFHMLAHPLKNLIVCDPESTGVQQALGCFVFVGKAVTVNLFKGLSQE